jgi:hypothetical protein
VPRATALRRCESVPVMGWTPPDLSASSCQLASCGVSVSATRRSPR